MPFERESSSLSNLHNHPGILCLDGSACYTTTSLSDAKQAQGEPAYHKLMASPATGSCMLPAAAVLTQSTLARLMMASWLCCCCGLPVQHMHATSTPIPSRRRQAEILAKPAQSKPLQASKPPMRACCLLIVPAPVCQPLPTAPYIYLLYKQGHRHGGLHKGAGNGHCFQAHTVHVGDYLMKGSTVIHE
jgi:hypothetical protein